MKVTATGRVVDGRRAPRPARPDAPARIHVRLRRRAPARSRARPPRPATTTIAPGSYTVHVTVRDPRWGHRRRLQAEGRGAVMGVLGWVTLLPLFGAALVMLVPRDEEAIHRGLGLLTTIVTFGVSLLIVADFDAGNARLPAGGRQAVDRAARHPVPPGRRRHLAVAGDADDVPDAGDAAVAAGDRHPQRPRPRVHRRDAGPGERHDRRVRRARPVPVLRVLGADADPDVLHHRHLGRRAAALRGDQVRHLHDGRVAADAGRDPVPLHAVQGGARAPPASTTRSCRT